MANWPSIIAMFLDQAEHLGEKPFLWAKSDGAYSAISWRDARDQALALARALRGLGIEHGDRVVLCAENRPEWMIANLGVMAAGAITVPAYITNTVHDHQHIFADSGAKAAIVSTTKLAERVIPAARRVSDVDFVISMEAPESAAVVRPRILTWESVLADGWTSKAEINPAATGTDETAVIIYTSGTGGTPKGVMLSHRALLHNCDGAEDALREIGLGNDVFLSFLPLSHAYEYMAGQCFPIYVGAEIYFAEGLEYLTRNLAETRPTIMTAVPRLYEVMHGRIMRNVEKQGGLKAKMFLKTVELGRRKIEDPKSFGLVDHMLDALLDKVVRDKVRKTFGGRLKALVSGGAPLNYEIGIFFLALGIRLLQGYGQTESAPLISVNRPRLNKLRTVGPPVKNTEVKIAPDGEILVRGELLMQGYWRNPEATRQAIQDGWLHTGDIGRFDDDGYIEITDRKKDIIVNSGGDTLSPQRVEGFLTVQPEIAQAMVHGDKRPHLVAVVIPNTEFAQDWAKANDKPDDLDQLIRDPQFLASIDAAVNRVNKDLSVNERVRRFILVAEPFTIENEMMTPTLKVRRHKVREVYGERLEALYKA
jgi:long-chain acyl-CoA synthetase